MIGFTACTKCNQLVWGIASTPNFLCQKCYGEKDKRMTVVFDEIVTMMSAKERKELEEKVVDLGNAIEKFKKKRKELQNGR